MWRALLHSPLRLLLLLTILVLLFLSLVPKLVLTELVLDPSYYVSTVVDFNKPLPGLPPGAAAAIHPLALLPHHRAGDLLLLDSVGSAFYSLTVPVSQDARIASFSGKGGDGFSDGDQTAASFRQPRSFAVDDGGNVYVADRKNFAIRKISSSGTTTTIAGGFSEKKTGHVDGPAQNATFSNDFVLVYVPNICALLISDRGSRLIRQINLKPADCAHNSQSKLGAVPVSIIAILCALLGMVLGFVARPFFAAHEVSINRFINQTWKHHRANVSRLMSMTYCDVKRGIANSALFVLIFKLIKSSIGFIYVVFRNLRLEKRVQCREPVSLLDSDVIGRQEVSINHRFINQTWKHHRANVSRQMSMTYCDVKRGIEKRVQCREPVSLLDSDVIGNWNITQPQVINDQLSDLISFDEHMDVLKMSTTSPEQETVNEENSDNSLCKIDGLITTNLVDFVDRTKQRSQTNGGFYNEDIVKRRPRVGRL